MKTQSKYLIAIAFMLTPFAVKHLPTVNENRQENRHYMALNASGYAASGAGTPAANGSYVPVSGANSTYNGVTQFTNGTVFAVMTQASSPNTWGIYSAVNAGGSPLYQNVNQGGSTTTFPLTGWNVQAGVSPAPTFTANSAASAPTTAPTLTISNATASALQLTETATVPSGVTLLDFFRGASAGGENTTAVQTVSVTAGQTGPITFQDNTVTVGTAYFYTAKWRNSVGSGPASAEVTSTASQAGGSTANSQPSNIVAVTPNMAINSVTNLVGFSQNNAALLQWSNPAFTAGSTTASVIIQQRLQVAPGTAPNPWTTAATLMETTSGNVSTVPTSVTITGLTNGVTYEFDAYATP